MDWKDIGKSVLSVAPGLAAALGGPAGMIAGGAIKVLTGFLGMDESASPENVSAELAKLTPENYVKLRELDNDYKDKILAAGVDLERISAEDRDSARKNQAATNSFTPDILAGILTVGFFSLLVLMYLKAPPAESKDLLNVMLGALGGAWTTAMAFFFGSSAGSDKLKNIIAAGVK